MAAIHGVLAPRFDGLQGQLGMLARQMTSLKTGVGQLSAQVQHEDQRMTEVERQIRDITAGKSAGTGQVRLHRMHILVVWALSCRLPAQESTYCAGAGWFSLRHGEM